MLEPPAQPRRRRLPDARTALGLLLVAAAVAGVLAVLAAGRSSAQVYRATADLLVGEPVDAASLELVEVELGDAAGAYLGEGALPEDGAVATRPVAAGELVPVTSLGAPDVDSATVLVPISGSLPASAAPGAAVDLWATAGGTAAAAGDAPAPVVLVESARVLRVDEQDGVIAGLGERQVELRVPREDVAGVLAAIGAGALLSLVPVYAEAG